MADKIKCIPIIKALADNTRWRMARELLHDTLTVKELTQRLALTQYNTSKHLRVLRESGLVTMERRGKFMHCAVARRWKQKITQNQNQLALGCCTFRFD